MSIPKEGDFSFIDFKLERETLEDAWNTVINMKDGVDIMLNKDKDEPWAFTSNPNCKKIINNLKMLHEHSGCSLALTMRQIENIIKYGWDKFYIDYMKHQS